VFAYVEGGDFFDGLRSRKGANGSVFSRHSETVTSFPDKLTAHVFAVLDECVRGRPIPEADNPQNFQFDEKFAGSLTFDGFWKQEFEEKPAELGPAAEGQIKGPISAPSNAEWWRYDFDIRAKNVPLSDALVIVVQSADGRIVTRLSGRVPAK
jgi:hypothetical protein